MKDISRRNLFATILSGTQGRVSVNSSLDEYTQPLSRLQVRHLLHRTTFGISQNLLDTYTGKKASEIVNILFANAEKNINPQEPPYTKDVLRNPANLTGQQKTDAATLLNLHNGDYNNANGEWWVQLMQKDTNSILEKLTLFWHGHFATGYASCDSIQAILMFKQNDLFRKNFAGNFRTMLEKITIDGAMLRYLNGNENISESPNENYARELLELFSIGVGNYSEQDIREAAKILTGWKITVFTEEGSPNVGKFNSTFFDKNSKLFMGEVFNVNYEINQQNVYENSVKKLINTILTKKTKEAATFISRKLYQFFVYSNSQKSDDVFISKMAEELIKNNFEFKPMLIKMFSSQHFFDDANIGCQIKSPAETIIGYTRHLKHIDMYSRNIMGVLGLELFNPPNVAGWKGYRTWISTKTLPFTIYFLTKEMFPLLNDETVTNWVSGFKDYEDPKKLTEKILELFFAKSVTPERLTKYTNYLLGGAPDYEWYEIVKNKATTGVRVKNLLKEVVKAPDYYLF